MERCCGGREEGMKLDRDGKEGGEEMMMADLR